MAYRIVSALDLVDDAALIAERRAAGVYGPRRARRQLFLTIAGVGSGLGMIGLLIATLA